MIRTDRRLRLCRTLLVCTLAFIWGNSLMPAAWSQAFSDWVGRLLGILSPNSSPEDPGSGILRKFAHFTEFACLGALLGWLFGMLRKQGLYALVCGVAAACIDETIQMFVPERGPGIRDVIIDSCGVLTGIVLLYLGHTYLIRKNNNHSLEDTK